MWFGGHKGISRGTPKVDLKFDTWLGVLKSYFLGVQISVVALEFVLDTCLNPID